MATMDEIKSACLGCKKCGLCETRTKLVFGVGNENAEIMLIGEGPGEQEDLQGVPFVGRAGKLLDDMLTMIDLDRTKVYIANIVKCRPPKNRDPLPEEKDACRDWLRAQIDLVKPKIIICLGRIAAAEIIGGEYKITKQHGQWSDINGIRCTAIYHPAALLRDVNKRPEAFADLREIRAEIRKFCESTYT